MSFGARMVELGWLPGITLWGTTSAGVPSAATSSAVRPKASALVWAKQLAISRSWWSPCSWVEVAEADEVGRDELGALVDELVEGVLAVGARLAPEDLAGLPHTGEPSRRTDLPLDSMVSCWR